METETSPIPIKRAVDAALAYVREVYGGEKTPGLRVEELVLSEDGKAWDVTVGWTETEVRTLQSPLGLAAMTSSEIVKLPRVYKRITIDARTGEVRSMRIRKVS